MDKNTRLIQLSEHGRFWRVELDGLSDPEQVFRAIWELESDVNNGGFEQYYFNSSGDTAFMVVGALKAIGASKAAEIAAAANSVFPSSEPPQDRQMRQVLLDELPPEAKRTLESLDQDFFAYPDDLTGLLFEYVKRNLASIKGARELGF